MSSAKSVCLVGARRDLKTAFCLGVGALALYLSTGRFFIDNLDGENYFLTTEAILRGDLWLDHGLSGDWWNKWGWKGRPFNPHGLGQPIAAIPFWYLGRALERYVSVASPQLVRRAAVTLLCPVVTAITVGLVFWFARRLGHSRQPAFAAAILFAAASPAWPYARYYFSEPLASLLLLAALYYLWAARAGAGLSAVAAAGALAGFAGLTRPALWPLVLLGAVLTSAHGRTSQRWAPGVYALFLLPSLALFAWYNYARFGSPFEQWPGGPNRLSLHTLPIGLYGQLLSPGKSVFLYCPLLIIALIGWRGLWRRDRLAAGAAAGVFCYHLFLYSAWTDWPGGWCWGPRFLFATLPLAWLAVPDGLERMWRKQTLRAIAAAIALLSLAMQVLAVSAFYMAHLDRLEAQGRRVSDSYYRWADSPILGAVTTLRHLHWSPLDRHSLTRVRNRATATEQLKAELRNTMDVWPVYLRRFGFGRWVWGVFALGLLACVAFWLVGWHTTRLPTGE